MRSAKMEVDWERRIIPKDTRLTKFRLFLQEKGIRDGTIENYAGNVGRYLAFAKTDHPSPDDYARFRETLHSWKLSRSTLNQYGYSVKAYHEMIGEPIKFKRISPNNIIPFYFTDDDVDRIFSEISNIKHLAMLSTLFFGCLRATELCQLNDEDVDLSTLTLRIAGKGGQEGLACINNDCANVLKEYLGISPPSV